MKNTYFAFLCLFLIGFTSCEVDEIINPNAPTVESFENGATLADLKLLANGLQSVIRQDAQFYFWTTSIVGREYNDLRGTDPRYNTELLGKNGGDLDNNGFLTTRSYFGRYRSIRNAILLKNAVANTSASLSASETNSLIGYANTVIGYELLLVANRQFDNGIRLDVDDIDNLGPFTGNYQESLAGIEAILDEGFSQLNSASGDVIWNLVGMNIPGSEAEQLAKFNRALAARVNIYQGDKAGALAALNNSFLDLEGDLDLGAYYAFGGATGNDLPNPLFYVPGVDNYMAHVTFVEDAEADDGRLEKVVDTGNEIALDGLASPYLVSIYESNTSPVSIIRNEELILIYAEANVGTNNDEAVRAINVIRNAAGLSDYDGPVTEAALIDQILFERRYSLFGEGHRWIDLRRYDRLDELPIDRTGDKVHVQFPRPASEV